MLRLARGLGFGLEDIAQLVGLWQNQSRSSAEVKQLALGHFADLETRIAEMRAMADTLRRLSDCCQGDERPDCPILDDLAEIPSRASNSRDSKQSL